MRKPQPGNEQHCVYSHLNAPDEQTKLLLLSRNLAYGPYTCPRHSGGSIAPHQKSGNFQLSSPFVPTQLELAGEAGCVFQISCEDTTYDSPRTPTDQCPPGYGSPVAAAPVADELRCMGNHALLQADLHLRNQPENSVRIGGKSIQPEVDVRLVNGTTLCSGRVEVKSNSSNQWSSVCEAGFDQQDAKVVCRELGCGPPSVLQGALYGEVEAPLWMNKFNCGGHESALLDCKTSGLDRNICKNGRAVGLTCSEPLRLVGGASRCTGTLELKHLGEWRPVNDPLWTLSEAAVVCKHLNCGSAVSEGQRKLSLGTFVWGMIPGCIQSISLLKDCTISTFSSTGLDVICSNMLFRPIISVSSSTNKASSDQQQEFQVSRDSSFNISCSIQPQFPGGSFQLSLNTSYTYTQPAVSHSAHFLFPAAEPFHQGNYSCVYHIYIFSHNFSSKSHLLFLTVSDATDSKVLLIRVAVLSLALLLVNTGLYFYFKIRKEQEMMNRKKTTGCVNYL
ncbi:uncharacterized protein FYW49_004008 [Xenentodon cancila]